MVELMKSVDFDPYDVLEMEHAECHEKDVVRAFRKMALIYHPDKNPHRKEYAEMMFLKISKAFEILSDPAARGAYERLRSAKQIAKERNKQLDAKRRKLKEELERRESGAFQQRSEEEIAARNLQKEIERLRKEGSTLLHREQEEISRIIRKERQNGSAGSVPSSSCEEPTPYASTVSAEKVPVRLRLKWTAKKDDSTNGGYDKTTLEEIFSKYGIIHALVVSCKRKGSAVLEYAAANSGVLAESLESGNRENPIHISWISGKPVEKVEEVPTIVPEKDFESVVLTKMRQAEERKRLIAKLQEEDANDDVQVLS